MKQKLKFTDRAIHYHKSNFVSSTGKKKDRVYTSFQMDKTTQFKGLNLCIETLDGLLKHNGAIYNNYSHDLILGKNIFKNKINFKKNPSLESQISSISDDIAYNSHDLEDGLKAKLFSIHDIKDIPVISDIINFPTPCI